MAGLISRLFGGQPKPDSYDPRLAGMGGYDRARGPAGEVGFPGSTSQTRTFKSNNPRTGTPGDWTTVKADTNTGIEQGSSGFQQVRQASYRATSFNTGRGMGQAISPRATPCVVTPQPQETAVMQYNSPAEFFGGPHLKAKLGLSDTTGGELTRKAAQATGVPENDPRDTTTLWKDAQPQISQGTPGAGNVRNRIAQRYKNVPGVVHAYLAAPRADVPRTNPGGQATDGNVHAAAATSPVQVPNRFVFAGGGQQTWSVEREMPYPKGHRGADLSGQRYYGTGVYDPFMNAGMGGYGVGRLRGPLHRPTFFAEPAPWSSQFYDTTSDVGTPDMPGSSTQVQDLTYVSPQVSRGALVNPSGRSVA